MSTQTTNVQSLLGTALSHSRAEQTEVSFQEQSEASTRFANNTITQNVAKRAGTITVRAVFGQQVGRATTNDLSAEGLRECVQRAEALARASAPDTEFLPFPGPQQYAAVDGYDERVASATPEDRAAGVRQALEVAASAGQNAAGSYATDTYHFATANSAGLFHEQRLTNVGFSLTAITEDSSGWVDTSSNRWGEVDPGRQAEIAIRKAEMARHPQDLPPGEYPVVLEPAAVADFLGFLAWTMDAKSAHEGRSAFSAPERHEGQRIGATGITLSTRPDHPLVPCRTASEDGVPLPATTWVEDGVLKTLSYGRYWAQKSGHPFTGRAANLVMEGEDHTVEELMAPLERGLLVTRFWYIRFVDPMKLLLTGMTRDGLYLIENGEVAGAVKNMRFNESPLACIERISARGKQVRAGRDGDMAMPAVRVDGFRFTSGTSF